MLISLLTACGVLLHDTNFDKAFVTAIGKTVVADSNNVNNDDGSKVKVGSTPHTHPEHLSLANILKERGARPRPNPHDDNRRRFHAKRTQNKHEFDGHRLCIAPGICF